MSNWKKDKEFEKEVMEYLTKKTHILSDIRCYHIFSFNEEDKKNECIDNQMQLKGVDFLYSPLKEDGKEKQGYCDVKSICCTKLDTFCFELQGKEDTNQIGWFLNDELLTDSYLLTYHNIYGGKNDYKTDKYNFNKDTVKETEAYWIKKKTLRRELEKRMKISWDDVIKTIKEDAKSRKQDRSLTYYLKKDGSLEFITSYKHSKNKKEGKAPIFYFSYSVTLTERPINVVVSRDFLSLIATKYWHISHIREVELNREEYEEIQNILNKYNISCDDGLLNIKLKEELL